MKTVFHSSELAHVWARQSQTEGRTPSNNFYFRGKTIYSYGSHFAIATILENNIVLFTTRSYSNTTAKHVANTRQAVSHKQIVYCAYPLGGIFEKLECFATSIRAHKNDVENTRKRENTRNQARAYIAELAENARKYCLAKGTTLEAQIKLLKKSGLDTDYRTYLALEYSVNNEFDYTKELTKLEKKVTANQKRALKERTEKGLENLELWLSGKFSTYNLDQSVIPHCMLRRLVKEDVDIVETTQGARVQTSSAKLLWSMIKAGKDIKGHVIDNYTVISLNGVLTIGCHKIERQEIERFAALMNW